jgi:hypothetical protein
MLLRFFLYKRLGVGAYLFEHRVSQAVHRLTMRKQFFCLLCDSAVIFGGVTHEVRVCLFVSVETKGLYICRV